MYKAEIYNKQMKNKQATKNTRLGQNIQACIGAGLVYTRSKHASLTKYFENTMGSYSNFVLN